MPSDSAAAPDGATGAADDVADGVTDGPAAAAAPRTFRLPGLAYLIVLFLLFCTAPLAFTDSGAEGAGAVLGPQALLLLIPIAAIVYIARTATVVDTDGIRIRAFLGSRQLSWNEIEGLSSDERNSVYAVVVDGMVRLPCVRFNDLAAVSKASGGRLPEVAEPKLKFALSRRPRRGRR